MSRAALLAAAVLLSSCGPSAPEEALEAGADSSALRSRKNLLVGFAQRPGAGERALLRSHGARIRAEFPEVNAVSIDLDEAKMGELARAGGVAYVEEDPIRRKLSLATSELAPTPTNGLYGLVTTGALDAHAKNLTGAGVKVCVGDTSLDYRHPDIAANYVAGIDTVEAGDADPINDDGETHGTHVAGTILGVKGNGQGVYGVAYGARLFHARVLGPQGGTTTDIMEGVRWLKDQGCHVVNLSLGGGRKSRTEENFFKEMRNAGVLVVAATGNDGATKVSYPAAYAVNIAVGAVDRNNALADFSNQGRDIDVVAPGVTVLSSVPVGQGSEASVATAAGSSVAFTLEFAPTTPGVTGTLVDCATGQVGEFPAAVTGNVALIQRGTISFADKVSNAMSAGAKAAVIYNNVPGDFTGTLGAEGSWIPAVTVSDVQGAALKSQVGSSVTVVSQVSDWDHFDGTSMATPHAAGILGLMLQAKGWTGRTKSDADAAESFLKATAKDLGAARYDTTFGYGLVQAP